MEIYFYRKSNGRYPVVEFLDTLQSDERTKVAGCLKSIETSGFETPKVEFREIKGSLWEIKIKTSAGGYRIFYVSIRKNIVLLHVYKKQSQKAPLKEILVAWNRMTEVLNNESTYTDELH